MATVIPWRSFAHGLSRERPIISANVSLAAGSGPGPYEILSPWGGGGWGGVPGAGYAARARGRDKVLAEEMSGNPERLRRLEQEARAASSLNHPNVVVVYDIGEADVSGRATPVRYVAMELLKGESLSLLIAEGRPMCAASSTSLFSWRRAWLWRTTQDLFTVTSSRRTSW